MGSDSMRYLPIVTMETLHLMTDVIALVRKKVVGIVREVHLRLKTAVQKYEEMENGSILFQLIVMIATQFQEMVAVALEQRSLVGIAVEELLC